MGKVLKLLQIFCVAGSFLIIMPAAPGDEVLKVGSRLELFVDDWLIARMDNLSLVMHRPRPGEVVMEFNRPWEGEYSAYVTVFQDEDIFRMYYRGVGADRSSKEVYAYAESHDGVQWKRPSLGLKSFQGSTDNNIIWMGKGSHNFAPFKDSNPNVPADERYKAVAGGPLRAFASADGLNWRQIREDPIISDGAFDSQNLVFWDPLRKNYVAFYRDFIRPRGEAGKFLWFSGIRGIKTATSPDFLNWTDGRYLDYGDAPLEHFY